MRFSKAGSLAALIASAFLLTASASSPLHSATADWKTYADPQGRFHFEYPATYQFNSGQNFMLPPYHMDTHWVSILRSARIRPSIHYVFYQQAAVLSVSSSRGVNRSACYEDLESNPMRNVKVVNGATYHVGADDRGAAGNDRTGLIYRTMYDHQCYEVALEIEYWPNEVETDPEGNVELMHMSPQMGDALRVQSDSLQKAALDELNRIFLTFRFTNY